MNERTTLEKIAPTVEEAIEEGLLELGLEEDQVKVEILDEGNKGFLGLGGRESRVRLTIIEDKSPLEKPVERQEEEKVSYSSSEVLDDDDVLEIAQATVSELLEKMGVYAQVSSEYRVQEDDQSSDTPSVTVNIEGNDLSILVSRRAEILNSLQFITRLIVGKELGHAVNLVVDVEGYRVRRERSLRKLATRMAMQVVKTGRKQSLEPMSPAERRIVHIALRDNEDVYTESRGERPKTESCNPS